MYKKPLNLQNPIIIKPPTSSTTVCAVSVYITAASPPVTVYNAVIASKATIATYRFQPSATSMNMAPENKSA